VGHRRFASPQSLIVLALATALLSASPALAQPKDKVPRPTAAKEKSEKPNKPEQTAFDFVLPGPNGKDVPMTDFRGKVVLLVNLARKSTYNAQLPALIKLSEMYKDKGLVVLGVPCDDFGAEEPGTDAEIQKAYADAKVTFPVMAVSKLTGDAELPLFVYLTKGKSALPGGPVAWNDTKLFLGKDGKPITRLGPDVAPDSPEMLATVDQILGDRFKPAKKDDKGGPPGDDDEDE
jgi:glutathione peroxidase